jgi:hypothetical protein
LDFFDKFEYLFARFRNVGWFVIVSCIVFHQKFKRYGNSLSNLVNCDQVQVIPG